MRCDKCPRQVDTLYKKMPLCAPHKDQVKAYRLQHQDARRSAAAKTSTQGK